MWLLRGCGSGEYSTGVMVERCGGGEYRTGVVMRFGGGEYSKGMWLRGVLVETSVQVWW